MWSLLDQPENFNNFFSNENQKRKFFNMVKPFLLLTDVELADILGDRFLAAILWLGRMTYQRQQTCASSFTSKFSSSSAASSVLNFSPIRPPELESNENNNPNLYAKRHKPVSDAIPESTTRQQPRPLSSSHKRSVKAGDRHQQNNNTLNQSRSADDERSRDHHVSTTYSQESQVIPPPIPHTELHSNDDMEEVAVISSAMSTASPTLAPVNLPDNVLSVPSPASNGILINLEEDPSALLPSSPFPHTNNGVSPSSHKVNTITSIGQSVYLAELAPLDPDFIMTNCQVSADIKDIQEDMGSMQIDATRSPPLVSSSADCTQDAFFTSPPHSFLPDTKTVLE